MGLPIYSASGFDLLSIFARIAHRPNPRVVLGPVDLTCSFVVVDVRRFDHPIVYCSPTFCTLTGYSENEVLHRNCRFLQAPNGQVQKGQPRPFTTESAVAHLRKSLMADKECQTSIVNYKKNGAAFVNLVTVIPVPGEDNEIAYHVGFQVDLGEQPNAILEKLKDGSYIINYTAQSQSISTKHGISGRSSLAIQNQEQHSINLNSRDRKGNSIPAITLSKELKRLLADPAFLRSFPIPTGLPGASSAAADESTTGSSGSHSTNPSNNSNHILHLFLLEAAPDFIHVVSLKGSFLYVAPSVRRVLGYEADEMIGKSLLDYAHPDDVVPLMRELKESSSTGVGAGTGTGVTTVSASSAAVGMSSTTGTGISAMSATPTPPPPAAPPPNMTNGVGTNNGGMLLPRPVDLLFRIKTKMGRFVWVECRGRLHVEPGKGRKAIILTGRAREMMNLKWEDVKRAGGLAKPKRNSSSSSSSKNMMEVEQETWGMLGGNGRETATFLSVGHGVKDVLGWKAEDLIGTALVDILHGENTKNIIGGYVQTMRQYQLHRRLSPLVRGKLSVDGAPKFKKLRCSMRRKDGTVVDVWFVLYRADSDESSGKEDEDMDNKTHIGHGGTGAGMSISPAPLVYQIRLVDAETLACGPDPGLSSMLNMVSAPTISTSLCTTSLSPSSSMFSPAGAAGGSLDSALREEHLLPSYDVFDELSVRRHTSWQYELQHLANTNANLEKQIQELEKAEAAALQAKSGVPSILQNPTGLSSSTGGYEATEVASAGYQGNTLVDILRMHQQQSQQQQEQQELFSRQPLSLPSYHALLEPPSGSVGANNNNTSTDNKPNLHLHSHPDSSPSHHASTSSTYLHHPQPKFSVQHTIATRERVGVIGDESPTPMQSAVHRHGYHESAGPMHQRQPIGHGHYHDVQHQHQSGHGLNRHSQSSTNTWGTVPIPPLDVALPLQSRTMCSPPPPPSAPGPASGSTSLKRSWAAVD